MSCFKTKNETTVKDLGGGVSRKVLAYSKNIMPVEVHLEKGAAIVAHSHPHEQVSYIISGRIEVSCGDYKKELKAGDSVYFSPNEEHSVVCLESGMVLDMFTPYREDFIRGGV